MAVPRLRRGVGAWVAAVVVLWSGLTLDGSSAMPSGRVADDYVYDSETTYCWGVHANVSSSDVTDDLVFVRGTKTECPLALQIEVRNTNQACVGQRLTVQWTVANAMTADSAVFPVKDAPALVDKRSRQRATIIHANVHTCVFGSGCDAFRQGETELNATTNQVANLSAAPLTFATSELVFHSPGKHVVLAHVIVPGPTLETRYDFAVFTTVDVAVLPVMADDATVAGRGSDHLHDDVPDANANANANATTKASPAHAMSKSQVIVLSVVGALLAVLFLVVALYARRNNKPVLCARKRDDSDLLTSKGTGSHFCVRGSNLRTRSSDWTELYAIDDMLPVPAPADDANAIAILRDSSRASTPCSTPTLDRTIADFRHDVARWDERSSASPITPSSSAILLAAISDPDQLRTSSPANDCFVPLESLMLASPPAVCVCAPSSPHTSPPRPRWKKPFRSSGRKRRQQQRTTPPPEDSGDEQEADI